MVTPIAKSDSIKSNPVSDNKKQPFFPHPQTEAFIHKQNEYDAARKSMTGTEPSISYSTFFKPSALLVQRNCSHCEEEEEKKLQRKISPELSSVDQHHLIIQRQSGGSTKAVTPTDEDRKDYAEMQDRFFTMQGEVMTGQILHSAGFKDDERPTTPEDAEKLVTFWGLSMSDIVTQMSQIASSLTTQVTGQTTSANLLQQQKDFIAALTTTGQQAYTKAIKLVKDEPFWNKYIADNEVYIFPDLQGKNRFSGYNQVVNDPNDPTGQRKVIIVHISADPLNNNFPELSSSTIVHELSHVLYEPTVLKRALASFRDSITDLLVDHPQIAATRTKAADPVTARAEQRQRISQILFETLAYGETEIFVHMQQLTHQPDVSIKHADGTIESLRGAQVLQHEILRYVRRLRKIGLQPQMLKGILDGIARRADILFDNRIAAWPAKSKQGEILKAVKQMAQLIFDMARRDEEL